MIVKHLNGESVDTGIWGVYVCEKGILFVCENKAASEMKDEWNMWIIRAGTLESENVHFESPYVNR